MTTTRRRWTAGLIALLLLVPGCRDAVEETPPRQLPGSPFHYPEELWDAGVEGETVLELHVNTAGRVDSASVERSSGYEAFDSAAVAGARDLSFEPGRRDGGVVAMRVLLPVQFHLPRTDDDDAPAPDTEVDDDADPDS